MLGDPSVDFVSLITPPNARQDYVRACAEAGMPVLAEKPIERTLTAAVSLVELCEKAGVPFGITFQHRARPSVLELRQRIDAFGPLRAAEVRVPWWRPQSYYDEPGRGTIERDGGGVMINQAIHQMDLALSFTGPASEVTAMSTTTALHRMEGEDFVSAGITLASGAPMALFASTACYPGGGDGIALFFDEVAVRITREQTVELAWHDGQSEVLGAEATDGPGGGGADPMAFGPALHAAVIGDFAEALAEDRPPMIPARDTLPVMALIAGIEESARQGRRVSVPQV